MNALTDRLLATIPPAGRPLRELRAQFADVAPGQLDSVLVGLKASGAIKIILGMVTARIVVPAPDAALIAAANDLMHARIRRRPGAKRTPAQKAAGWGWR